MGQIRMLQSQEEHYAAFGQQYAVFQIQSQRLQMQTALDQVQAQISLFYDHTGRRLGEAPPALPGEKRRRNPSSRKGRKTPSGEKRRRESEQQQEPSSCSDSGVRELPELEESSGGRRREWWEWSSGGGVVSEDATGEATGDGATGDGGKAQEAQQETGQMYQAVHQEIVPQEQVDPTFEGKPGPALEPRSDDEHASPLVITAEDVERSDAFGHLAGSDWFQLSIGPPSTSEFLDTE